MISSTSTRALVVATVLAAASLYLAHATRAEVTPSRESLETVPMRVGAWTGHREPDFEPKILKVLGVDDYLIRTYATQSSAVPPIGLYVGYYQSQRQGDTMHSPLNCLPGAGWEPVDVGRATIDVQDPPGARNTVAPIEVNRVIIQKGIDRQMVFYWYQSDQRVVASEYWGKIYTVLDAVRYNRTDAALIRVVTPVVGNDAQSIDAADTRGRQFVQAMFPLLRPHLPS